MTDQRTRVLFVGAFPPPEREVFGGMVSSCRALLQSSFSKQVDLDPFDTTQISNPPPGVVVRALLAFRRIIIYVVRLERKKPDAVLLFASIGGSIVEKGAMAWYARMRGIPAMLFPRGGGIIDSCDSSDFTRLWVRFFFRGARKVFCQSERWQKFAVNTLGFSVQDSPVIMNWTASPELLAIGRDREDRVDHVPRLLFLGWLDLEKGVNDLLVACRELGTGYRFKLGLVGEGDQSELARKFVIQNNMQHLVEFTGWLGGDKLLAEFARADIFVLPSWAEGLPNAMVEAMATRLPIIVTAVGSVPDVVVDNREALLVKPRDVAGLVAAIKRLLDDPSLRSRLAAAAYATAEERFSVEPAAKKLVDEIYSAVGRQPVQ